MVAPLVPAVKPQAAFFEELGPPGMQALADVIRYARERGLLVIVDGKRNDIGSTATAYARAYLGADQSAWGGDALTVSPYLGADSIEPFVETGRERRAGIFVLVKTSNPGGGQFQDLVCDGRPLYRHVAEFVERLAAASAGPSGYGDVGAVVGATWPEQLVELRQAMPHAWLLIPGFGSQGGTARDVQAGFDARGRGAIVNNSRGIIFAHARPEYAGRFAAERVATGGRSGNARDDCPIGGWPLTKRTAPRSGRWGGCQSPEHSAIGTAVRPWVRVRAVQPVGWDRIDVYPVFVPSFLQRVAEDQGTR